MIVVDTNVISEPLRIDPDPSVLEWLASHRTEVAVTSITVGELVYGASRLQSERRRAELLKGIDRLLRTNRARLLAYDEDAALTFGALRAETEAVGRPRGVEDLMIAAIGLSRNYPVATRNIRHFEELGLTLINPWES